jgi:NitT/TauT family transport system ATP-binding protein
MTVPAARRSSASSPPVREHDMMSDDCDIVTLRDVGFQYARGQRAIFSNLSLEVRKSEFVAVVGPSGYGKSTLLRLIAGLLRPTSGTVVIEGRPITGPSNAIGLVFQNDTLLPWRTAAKNIQLGIEGRLPRVEVRRLTSELLDLVGLSAAADLYPHQLSGGMRQRVNLARALALEPDILLMDEPFASLDAQTRESQQEYLLSIWESTRKTIIFVTHDIDEAVFLADRVIVMRRASSEQVIDVPVSIARPRVMELKADSSFRDLVNHVRHLIRHPSEAMRPREE